MTGMSNHFLDHWALELQFHVKFEHIQGKTECGSRHDFQAKDV